MFKRIIAGLFLSLLFVQNVVALQTIVLKPGDTLSKIAREHGTTVESLANVNGIKNPDLIIAGRNLVVPDEPEGELLGFSVATRYRTTLRSSMTASQTTIPVSSLLSFDGTLLTMQLLGGRVFLDLEAGTSREEIVMCEAITGSNFSSCTRGLAFTGTSTAGVTANRMAHNAGSSVTMSNVHYIYDQLVDRDSDENISGIKTFVSSTIRIGDNTTSTNKTIQAYNGDTNLPFLRYNELIDQWQFSNDGLNTVNLATSSAAGLSASSTQGIQIINSQIGIVASTTRAFGFGADGSAGVNIVTSTGLGFSTATPTGSLQIVTSTLLGNIASTTPTANLLPQATASGTINPGWVPASGSNTLTTGEAINGSVTPQLVMVSSTGLVYAADADDVGRTKVYGFVTTNALVTTTPIIITNGIVPGFSGLTPGAQYYASSTAGAISNTPYTTTSIPIGQAISASQLRINFGQKKSIVQPTTITNGTGSVQTFTLGYRPEEIEITAQMQDGNTGSTGTQAKQYAKFLGTTQVTSYRTTNDPTTQYDEFSVNQPLGVGSTAITVTSITDTGFSLTFTGGSIYVNSIRVLVSGN